MPPSDRRRDRQVNSGTFSRLEAAVTDLKRQRETTIELVKRLSPPQAENAKVPFHSVQSPSIPAPSTLFAHSALSASSSVPVQRFALPASTSRPALHPDNSEDFNSDSEDFDDFDDSICSTRFASFSDDLVPSAGTEEPPSPPMSDDDQFACQDFYNDCRSYIRSHPETFQNDSAKIRFVMSHMVSGHTGHWANQELGAEQDGALRFANWADFAAEFRKLFMSPNVEKHASNLLESDHYFQRRQTVSDYLEYFQDLIDDAGCSNPQYIVTKFRRGLNHEISAKLALSAAPSLADPEAWFSLAIQADTSFIAEEVPQIPSQPAVTSKDSEAPIGSEASKGSEA